MALARIKNAALGRPFTLGMLYDARKDELITGFKLWDIETLQEKITETSQPGSAFEISSSDSIESKTSLLDVDSSLKASLITGLIEVGGYVNYLNDKKKSHNQSRVTCQYNATTIFKELSMKGLITLDPQQKDVIKMSSATHVVTGILYGANAFFVFDSEKIDTSSVKETEAGMEAVLKKIPKVGVEGKAGIKLSDEEKALTEKFSCKFYGDFLLESNPTTFEEAVQTYVQLSQLLRENGEKAVPVTVWLTPLKELDPEAAEMMSGISDGLVRKIEDILEDLREIGMRCNDSLEDQVAENFPQIREELSSFQRSCDNYESNLQKSTAEKLPSIREGTEDESALQQLFDDRTKSPFSHDKLTKWLDDKEREITVIRSCVDAMKGTKIVPNQNELDKEVLAPGVRHAVCFVFTSLETADLYLDAMTKYFDSPDLRRTTNEDPWYFSDEVFASPDPYQDGKTKYFDSPDLGSTTNEESWYSSDEVVSAIKSEAKCFGNLSNALKDSNKVCFLIAAIANEKYTGATLYHYKKGILVTKDVSKPDLPAVEDIADRCDLIWYTSHLTLDPNTANGYLTLSEGDEKATCGEEKQKYPDHPERFTSLPQVLCKEGLTGHHYWEVEWHPGSVYVCVAYKEIERKSGNSKSKLGSNAVSWAFGEHSSVFTHSLRAYHDGKVEKDIPFPSSGCSRVGVYLDWPAGTLSFYRVSSYSLTHLYTFKTTFTEPVYPGFRISDKSNYAYLNRFE